MARALSGDDLSRVPTEQLVAELTRREDWTTEDLLAWIFDGIEHRPITTLRDISTVES